MNDRISHTFALLMVSSAFALAGAGPSASLQDPARSADKAIAGTFESIEHGFASGSASLIGQHLAPDLKLRIGGAPEGYYSANQASEILRHYFSGRSVMRFSFTKREVGDSPYATGGLGYVAGGRKTRSQVYVGLSLRGGRWMVTQLSIY